MGLSPGGDKVAQLKALLDGISKQMAAPQGGGAPGGVISPGQTGGAPQALATPPPIPGLPGVGNTPVPSSAASMPQRQYTPIAPGAQGSVGFNFPTRGAARSATAYSIMEDLKGVADKVEKQSFERQASEAEYLMHEYWDARTRGDTETANAIASDPKFKKMLKKFQGFSPFEVNDKPPEVVGIEKAAQKIATQPPSQSNKINVRPPTASATQEQLEKLKQQILASDPAKAAATATGTTLSGKELYSAELISAGLKPSPAIEAQMTMEQRQLDFKASQAMLDREHDAKIELSKEENQVLLEKLAGKSAKEVHEIMAGPQYARIRQIADVLNQKDELVKAKQQDDSGKLAAATLKVFQHSIDSDSAQLAKMQKDGTSDSEDAQKLRKQISEYGEMVKQYQLQMPNPVMDQIRKWQKADEMAGQQ